MVARLRAAGCVFAEDEAAVLREAARDPADLDRLAAARVAGAPLEPLVGWVDFDGLRLRLGPGVFVPRRRSVAVARRALDALTPGGVLVEAYCGVAPLATWLQRRRPAAEVHVTDVDPLALAWARRNLSPGTGIHRGSVLAGLPERLRGRIDVLVAVPPYVPDGAAALLPREAREHEPPAALFGGPEGTDHLRALTDEAAGWVAAGGLVVVEMGIRQARSWAPGPPWVPEPGPVAGDPTVALAWRRR